LPATFAPFPVLSLRYTHAQLRSLYLLSTFNAAYVTKSSPHLHNFSAHVLERGNLGTRLQLAICAYTSVSLQQVRNTH